MIHDHEYICPKCGTVCASLTEFHKHVKEKHHEETK